MFHRLILFTLFLFATADYSAALVIDDFLEGPIVLNAGDSSLTFSQSQLDPEHVVGGTRDFELSSFGTVGQFVSVKEGSLTLGREAGLAYLRLTYGSDSQPLSIDLTSGGSDRFLFDSSFEAPGTGWMRIGSPGGQRSIVSLYGLRDEPYLLYSQFSSGADFTNVSWIQLEVVRSGGFTIGAIQTVPEPNSVAVGLLLCSVLLINCRKKSAPS